MVEQNQLEERKKRFQDRGIRIGVTENYEALVEMFIRNDLEFSEEDEVPTDLVKCWAARDTAGTCADPGSEPEPEQGRLIGGCVLARREGEFIIDGIAVEADRRELKLGAFLLDLAKAEAKAVGGDSIYLVARAPEFFRKQGFVTVEREAAPNFFECFTCPQYQVSCFPEVMRIRLR